MKLEEFLRVRDELRVSRPGLVDCSELNLYRSLARLDSVGFGAIAPSKDPRSQYRCHVAEEFLARLGLGERWRARAQVSHGVRRSLRVLFGVLAARGGRIAVPNDVYPVYGRLAAEAGVEVVGWSARAGLPDDRVLGGVSALLVCEPLKPWGRTLDAEELERLRRWVRTDLGRMLILDSAYAIPPSAAALSLMEEELGIVLVSLSKGWLIPDHVGLCIVPARWQELARGAFSRVAKEEVRLRIGFAALTEHGDRCQRVGEVLAELGGRLDAWSLGRGIAASECVGYFAASGMSFEGLLERGVLGVPASVFGGHEGCLLSSLPPASESLF